MSGQRVNQDRGGYQSFSAGAAFGGYVIRGGEVRYRELAVEGGCAGRGGGARGGGGVWGGGVWIVFWCWGYRM